MGVMGINHGLKWLGGSILSNMTTIDQTWAHDYIERILYTTETNFPIVLGNKKIGSNIETQTIHNKDEFYYSYNKNYNHPACTEIFLVNKAGKIIEI